jgi:hypothetical protein
VGLHEESTVPEQNSLNDKKQMNLSCFTKWEVFSLLQVNKFGDPSDQSAFMMPFMRPFFYHESSYVPLHEQTLKDYVRNQM